VFNPTNIMKYANAFFIVVLFVFFSSFTSLKNQRNDDGYSNPIIFADYSDPDVIRVDDNFYMVSSSFSHFPGLPILHSKDLLHWRILGHAATHYPVDSFKIPQHGNGIWAPSIQYHNGEFYIYFGDPDNGIFMTKSKKAEGPWEPLHLVKEAKGWIDACPFWDDDGNTYLVHAWAKSRAGINSILTLNKMSPDGKNILDEGKIIFEGHKNHPTIEGPKMYKRNGFYYILAPAGGVKQGWQTVLRSKSIYGPYEDKIVLEQGSTDINGPHQGALIELESGESWFVHFQDKEAYGRVVHLNPVNWIDDWPMMGIDFDSNGIGEPVSFYKKPNVGNEYPPLTMQTTDEFDSSSLGLQWQWEADFKNKWFSLDDKNGYLRLFSIKNFSEFENLRKVPNLLGQKFPAEEFSVTVKLIFSPNQTGERTGLVILGSDYCDINVTSSEYGLFLNNIVYLDSNKKEELIESIKLLSSEIYFKVSVKKDAVCNFYYSTNGENFIKVGNEFNAKPGRWVGAKICFYSISVSSPDETGYSDFDWIRFTDSN